MTNNAAVLRSVEKRYKDFTLGPIDLTIPTGTIVGLVGENGAGKTTTLKLLCGVNPADAGEITLLGSHPTAPAIRARLGVVFEDAYFYSGLNAEQIGKSMAGIFGDRWNAGQFADYLQRFGLDAKKKVSEYSRGMRMKLSLATALAHNPDLLVLDEATAGLDPEERVVWACIPGDYSGQLLFVFANGKVARVELSAYQTQTRRKKLTGAYSDKAPLAAAFLVREDFELAVYSSDGRCMVFHTALLAPKTTRTTQGVNVMTLKPKRVVEKALPLGETAIVNAARYRARSLPVAGALLKEEDRGEKQMSLLEE